MKAFKYLVFLFCFFLSSFSYAAFSVQGFTGQTKDTACQAYFNSRYTPTSQAQSWQISSNGQYCILYNINGQSIGSYGITEILPQCPSATSKDLKVPVNAKTYVCVDQCQYKLRACVDVDIEPGMTCTAISTGQNCGTTPPVPQPDPNKPNATPDPSDPTPDKTNSATTNGTSTSTSTTTTNNNGTSTSTTTVTNTTTTNNTTINLDGLENTMKNLVGVISNKLDAILGKMDQDGGDDGSTGNGEGTDLTEIHEKLDENNSLLSDLKDWLTGGEDGSNGSGGDNPFGNDAVPEKQLTEQTFQTNLFSGSAACPADRTLSFTLFTGRSFSKTFSFAMWCDKLQIFGYFILIASYLYGALIITRNS